MTIGSRIKALRRARDLTQESLAEYLGISPKAVSQWECDRTSPDISQIPLLCNLFEVTSDELLGIDVKSKQKRIDEIYSAAWEVASTGDHKRSISMWLDGIREFPDSFKLIGQYVDEVYMYSHMLEDKEEHVTRALSYIRKIISDCTDSKIRNEAMTTACMWYSKLGRGEEAKEIAECFPDVTRADMQLRTLDGTAKYEKWRENILGDFIKTVGDLTFFARSKNDSGEDIFTDDEKIMICKKQAELLKAFFENGDYAFHAQYLEIPFWTLARIYGSRHDAENTLDALAEAAKYAMIFDTYDPDEKQTSVVARGNVPGGVWWHDSHNRCYDVREFMEDIELFGFVSETEKYREIIQKLSKVAK